MGRNFLPFQIQAQRLHNVSGNAFKDDAGSPINGTSEMTCIPCPIFASIAFKILGTVTSLRLMACALLAAFAVSAAAACPLDTPKLRVSDSVGLLGEKAGEIADRLANYQERSGHQVFLLVIPSLGAGTSIEECAVTIFKQWQLGRKGVDDGVLLLVAVKERKLRIEVGYGLEGDLTDAQSSRIIHEVMGPLFARGEYAEGTERGLDAIMAVLGPTASIAPSAPPVLDQQHSSDEQIITAAFGLILLLVLLLTPMMGIVGLLVCSVPGVGFAHWVFPDWRAHLLVALIAAAWSALRWGLIRNNVRKYRSKKSRHKALTWIWCFIAFGNAAPAPKRRATASRAGSISNDDGDLSFSFGGDSSDGGSSGGSGGSGGTGDGGGASGGAGASGTW